MTTGTVRTAPSDPIVCYCFNRTSGQLRDAYSRLGSLSKVQSETRVGSKCGGCRLILESMFEEKPDEILNLENGRAGADICVRKGQRLMKGFVAADHRLDTVIFSSNGVPPQFTGSDTAMTVEYMLLDMEGRPVLHRSEDVRSDGTFRFDTRKEDLKRPFYGMFLFQIARSNYGGARFNSVWTNGVSACSTHEINDSGRPSVVLPIPVDRGFHQGPNSIFLALQNPHAWPIRLRISIQDASGGELGREYRELAPLTTRWVAASRDLYGPILDKNPQASLIMKFESDPVRAELAPTIYFFLRNLNTDIWTANHL